MNDFDPIVFARIQIAYCSAAVGRPVIYQNNLQILVALLDQALNAEAHILINVINRNYNTYKVIGFYHYVTSASQLHYRNQIYSPAVILNVEPVIMALASEKRKTRHSI